MSLLLLLRNWSLVAPDLTGPSVRVQARQAVRSAKAIKATATATAKRAVQTGITRAST